MLRPLARTGGGYLTSVRCEIVKHRSRATRHAGRRCPCKLVIPALGIGFGSGDRRVDGPVSELLDSGAANLADGPTARVSCSVGAITAFPTTAGCLRGIGADLEDFDMRQGWGCWPLPSQARITPTRADSSFSLFRAYFYESPGISDASSFRGAIKKICGD